MHQQSLLLRSVALAEQGAVAPTNEQGSTGDLPRQQMHDRARVGMRYLCGHATIEWICEAEVNNCSPFSNTCLSRVEHIIKHGPSREGWQ